MTTCPWISWGMTKPQAQEFKLFETHGEMKDGTEKKIERVPNGKIHQEENVATHSVHNDLAVHVCGVIQKQT